VITTAIGVGGTVLVGAAGFSAALIGTRKTIQAARERHPGTRPAGQIRGLTTHRESAPLASAGGALFYASLRAMYSSTSEKGIRRAAAPQSRRRGHAADGERGEGAGDALLDGRAARRVPGLVS